MQKVRPEQDWGASKAESSWCEGHAGRCWEGEFFFGDVVGEVQDEVTQASGKVYVFVWSRNNETVFFVCVFWEGK